MAADDTCVTVTDNIQLTGDLQLSALLSSMIKEHTVLVEKSQLPRIREKKAKAIQEVKARIAKTKLRALDEKQILKKIANMKGHIKKKIELMNQRKTVTLCPWEQELYQVLKGKRDFSVSMVPSSHSMTSSIIPSSMPVTKPDNTSLSDVTMATELVHERDESCDGCKGEMELEYCDVTSHEPMRGVKRSHLPGETEETASLTIADLRRLVLLEQLRYTRMKIRRLEQQGIKDDHPPCNTHCNNYFD
ncbi:uncharacterized protein LOC121410037 [Lytechinus variegatus]|uniref:uncharacterized protein LOC121410037 n=1 Tax=Lytechinus variegatus TaxID=7654 RepID=UPI001BB1A989|nr:uncharacterized protein LOC121410037 [Lytechinus variegatus]